jgi:hypothetical protein
MSNKFNIGDDVVLTNKNGLIICGHLIYKIIKKHGFWKFRTYDICSEEINGNKITQCKVPDYCLMKVQYIDLKQQILDYAKLTDCDVDGDIITFKGKEYYVNELYRIVEER